MREQVLDAAERMVQERGLNAVSFQQLADAVGLSKASVFHHFPDKQALTAALIDRCRTKYGPEYGAVIDGDSPAPAKLRRIAEIFEQGLRDDRLCLLSSLGQSVGAFSDPVQEDLQRSVSQTIDRYARVFEQGRRQESLRFEGSPIDAAAAFLAMVEGLQVLARTKRDPEMFGRAAKTYIDSISH